MPSQSTKGNTTKPDDPRTRTYEVPALQLSPSAPAAANDDAVETSNLVQLKAFAAEIGSTANALRQRIGRGELREGIDVHKAHGRWYVDRRSFERSLTRQWRGAA